MKNEDVCERMTRMMLRCVMEKFIYTYVYTVSMQNAASVIRIEMKFDDKDDINEL
jgi:hypothetical protein